MCEPTDQPNSQQGQQHCQIEFYAIETTPTCPRFPLETSVRFPERLVRSGVDVRRVRSTHCFPLETSVRFPERLVRSGVDVRRVPTHFGWYSSSAGMHVGPLYCVSPKFVSAW